MKFMLFVLCTFSTALLSNAYPQFPMMGTHHGSYSGLNSFTTGGLNTLGTGGFGSFGNSGLSGFSSIGSIGSFGHIPSSPLVHHEVSLPSVHHLNVPLIPPVVSSPSMSSFPSEIF